MVDNCGRAYQGQDAMQITSLDNARLKEALDRDRLNLPKQPRVLEVRSELGADSRGEEAVTIWVILEDNIAEADRT